MSVRAGEDHVCLRDADPPGDLGAEVARGPRVKDGKVKADQDSSGGSVVDRHRSGKERIVHSTVAVRQVLLSELVPDQPGPGVWSYVFRSESGTPHANLLLPLA